MLPRKGDRVRIVECGTKPRPGSIRLTVGTELRLCDDAVLVAWPAWLELPLELVDDALRAWSSPVRVEPIDSPAIQSAREGLARLPYPLEERSDFENGYQAGLRRAQELAREHMFWTGEGIEFGDFDDAIEKELKS